MTAINSKITFRTILDFSNELVTKSHIRTQLRTTEVPEIERSEQTITYVNNQIQVGMYTILLVLPDSGEKVRHRLREYGNFLVRISENSTTVDYGGNKYDFLRQIDFTKDPRFRSQKWSHNHTFNMTDLTEIILHCHRLHGIKAFL